MKYILFFIFLFSGANHLFSQDVDDFESPLDLKDSVCFAYNFHKSDTLLYFIESMDSIVIDYGDPLLKVRRELLKVTVDKITKNNSFILKLKLTEFQSKEVTAGEEIERNSNPWVGRFVFLEIDSLGNRLSYKYDDSSVVALAPGGAFGPYLFFPFRQSCKEIEESWSVSTLDKIAENGLPVPLLRQSSLFKAENPLDTLNFESNRFSFVKTAQGNYEVDLPDQKLTINNIINGHGILTISEAYKVPVHYFATQEQKLTIKIPGAPDRPGWHYTTSNFTLVNHNLDRRKN